MINIGRIREILSEWIRPKESPDLGNGIKFEKSLKEDLCTSKGGEISKKHSYYIYLSRVFNDNLRVYEYFFLDEKKTLIRHYQDFDGDIQHQVIDFYFNILGEEFLKNNNVHIKLVKY